MKKVLHLILITFLIISCSAEQQLAKEDGLVGDNNAGGDNGGVQITKYTVTVDGDFSQGKIYLNGQACAQVCSGTFEEGAKIMVVAIPNEGNVFEGISGASCDDKQYCPVTVTQDFNLDVSFSASPVQTHQLSFNKVGNGTIFIDGGNCAPDCDRNLPEGTEVTLSAVPDFNNNFVGFSGDCTGTSVCRLTMNKAMNVTATFAVIPVPVYHNLSFTSGAGGDISVNSVSCGPDCSGAHLEDTQLVLTATPTNGYTFNGFTGDCSGTGPCNLTMDGDKTVGASFTAIPKPTYYDLTFTSNVPGGLFINGSMCTTDCSGQHLAGTTLTLTATPPNGYNFDSFGGDCSGNTCVVTMNSDQAVSVNFVAAPTSVSRGLAWDSSTDADGYRIYFGRSSGTYDGDCLVGNQTSPLDVPTASLSDSDNPMINLNFKQTGAACYLTISAYNAVGESNPASEITFTP